MSEIARVLRPGGRVGISDVVAEDRLTPADRAARGSSRRMHRRRPVGLRVPGGSRPGRSRRHRGRADAHGCRRDARSDRACAQARLSVARPSVRVGYGRRTWSSSTSTRTSARSVTRTCGTTGSRARSRCAAGAGRGSLTVRRCPHERVVQAFAHRRSRDEHWPIAYCVDCFGIVAGPRSVRPCSAAPLEVRRAEPDRCEVDARVAETRPAEARRAAGRDRLARRGLASTQEGRAVRGQRLEDPVDVRPRRCRGGARCAGSSRAST